MPCVEQSVRQAYGLYSSIPLLTPLTNPPKRSYKLGSIKKSVVVSLAFSPSLRKCSRAIYMCYSVPGIPSISSQVLPKTIAATAQAFGWHKGSQTWHLTKDMERDQTQTSVWEKSPPDRPAKPGQEQGWPCEIHHHHTLLASPPLPSQPWHTNVWWILQIQWRWRKTMLSFFSNYFCYLCYTPRF